jgi:nucleobase:cation symporter-1, NCS1 family
VIWSLSASKTVGPLFYTGQNTGSTGWSFSWTMMSCLNSAIGVNAAGMTNGSDFSRYGKNKSGFIGGTILCVFVTGVLVCLVALVTTSSCQHLYGQIYWNPPDLLMVMMDYGRGSSKSRAGVFFLALGFALPVRSILHFIRRFLKCLKFSLYLITLWVTSLLVSVAFLSLKFILI